MIVIGVDQDRQVIGRQIFVPPNEAAADLRRLAVVEPGPHVERVLPDQDTDLGALGHRPPLVGVALGEPIDRRRLGPGRIVELPIHPDVFGDRSGVDRRGILMLVDPGGVGRLGEGGQGGEQHKRKDHAHLPPLSGPWGFGGGSDWPPHETLRNPQRTRFHLGKLPTRGRTAPET